MKGTQTDGEDILLTPNEIDFAEAHHNQMALFIVRNICVVSVGSTLSAEGGCTDLRMHWHPNRERLTPVCFSYRLEEKVTFAKTML